eukprot:7782743-Alexandrium_andersonii.AAC.1
MAQGSKLVRCQPGPYREPEAAPFLLDLIGRPGRRRWRGASALELAQRTGRATTSGRTRRRCSERSSAALHPPCGSAPRCPGSCPCCSG